MRIREESKTHGASGLDYRDLHIPVPFDQNQDHEPGEAEMNFYVVRNGGVESIGVFLTEDLLERLHAAEAAVWQGVLEFVEDHLARES